MYVSMAVKKKTKKKVVKKMMKKKPKGSVKKIKRKPIVKKKLKKVVKKARREPILKKSVTKQKRYERAGTGIKNFDSLIEGGFREDSTNLVVGGSGSGKTIFGMQFLVDGMEKGDPCLYISFEERKNEFFKNLSRVGIDVEKYEKQGKFFFLEYTPQKVKTMLDEGGGAIETLVLTKSVKRIVIDSISSFTLLFEKELQKKDAALALFGLLKGWDCTTVLISDEDSIDQKETSKIIDQEVDSITLMYFKRGGKVRKRFIEVLKMRGTNHSLKVHSFEIGDKGLVVSKRSSKK